MIWSEVKISTCLFEKSMFIRNEDLKVINIYIYTTYHCHETKFTHSYWIFIKESVTWNFNVVYVHSACFQKVF